MTGAVATGAVRWFVVSVVLSLLVVIGCWWFMPEGRIPLHWGADGQPDNWGTRTQAMLLLLAVWAVFAGLMAGFVRWSVSMNLTFVNVPHKEHWSQPANEPVLRARLREDMALTGVWMMALVGVIAVLATVTTRENDGMDLLVFGCLGAMMVVLFAGLWVRSKFYRDI